MEIKIYREQENVNLLVDDNELQEYNQLVKELGLTRREENVDKTPIVYPYLNHVMRRQIKALTPVSVNVENYSKSTIPVEILKVYKNCKDNEMFEGYKIWYNDVNPDPILIGWKYTDENARKNKYSWQTDPYLIARWGDCALSIEELINKGNEVLFEEFKNNMKILLNRVEHVNKDTKLYFEKALNQNLDLHVDLGRIANFSI